MVIKNNVSKLKDAVPPHNLEAEEATLGALLLNSEALSSLVGYLRPEDFYQTANQNIYKSIISLYDRNEAVELINLTDERNRQ